MAAGEAGLRVDLQVSCDAADLPDVADVEECLNLALTEAAATPAEGSEVSLRIVDEAEMRELNGTYRGLDRSTNVLAFPAALADMPGLPADSAVLLGDLVICAPVVAREAAEQDKAASAHWCHMLVHGMLHLLGYDHENDVDARAMEELEVRILARRGLENPYEGAGRT